MKNFFQVASGIDTTRLALELQRNPQLWNAHTWRKVAPNTPHSAMDDIWVRYNDCAPFEKGDRPWSEFNNEHDPIWYPSFYSLPSLRSHIFGIMSMVEGERLGGVLITRVPAGTMIDRHIDSSWHVSYYDKYYLSIEAPPTCTFHAGTEVIVPRKGDLWWFDNTVEHWVENPGPGDRITLIVCVRGHRYGAAK